MSEAHALITRPRAVTVIGAELLSYSDLDRLTERRGVGGARLKNVRQVHHKIARMMAAGMSNVEISAVVGFHHSRLSILRNDPAFQELLVHYENEEEEIWHDVREQAAELGTTAVQEIHQRILEHPEKVATRDLIAVMEKGLDYGGKKPPARTENLHAHTTLEQLQKIKEGRKENVSVRGGHAGDDDELEAAGGAEPGEEGGGEEIREAGVGFDPIPAGGTGPESVD